MEYRVATDRPLLRLDMGRPDHLAPFLGFVSNQLPKIGWRAGEHRAAKVGKPRLEFGIGESRVDTLVELLDYLGGRLLGRADPPLCARLVTR